jgi:hypothetical protein
MCSLAPKKAYHFIVQAGDINFIFFCGLNKNGHNSLANTGECFIQYREVCAGLHGVWMTPEAEMKVL